MSDFSFINILLGESRRISADRGVRVIAAKEIVARRAGFSSFGVMRKAFLEQPSHPMIMLAAVGVERLEDALYVGDVYDEFVDACDNQLAGEAAVTNAINFSVEDLEFIDTAYDDSDGSLSLDLSFLYAGECDGDRPYGGAGFYVNALVVLIRQGCKWVFKSVDLEAFCRIND